MITENERRAIFEMADFWENTSYWGIVDVHGQWHQ